MAMVKSLLMPSFGHMHASHQHRERERGRSRTPKSAPIAVTYAGNEPDLHRRSYRANVHPARLPHTPPPPRKRKSPDRSEPGALEDAIHEAHADGDLRQCLQWVLELQGVYLDWDDPRLDTVTEDDLCFAESAGMGPDATPEERARAEQNWAMRKAEEDEARRVWELTATAEEKAVSRKLRAQLEAEQKARDARAQYFRAPRHDKMAAPSRQRPSPIIEPAFSRSLDSIHTVQPVIRRPPRTRQDILFPVDEAELFAVRSMWHEQRRRGIALVEMLVRPSAKPSSSQPSDTTVPMLPRPRLDRPDSSDSITSPSSSSTSASSSCSAPSALFSSILTTTSIATSVSTVTDLAPPCSPSKTFFPRISQAEMAAPAKSKSRFVLVPSTESPLHQHAASVSLRETRETREGDRACRTHIHRRTQSAPHIVEREVSHTRRGSADGWLSKGGRAVEGLVDLVSRLPTSYLPTDEFSDPSIHTVSCPHTPRTHTLNPNPSLSPETFICLLPLKRPTYVPVFPAIPTLPRSPYRPITPPPKPTHRMRLVSNPQFLRLKALQNRVLWGLVPVSQAEYDALTHIEQAHEAAASPGRPDVDRCGHIFSAKESLLRVAVDGAGRSLLGAELPKFIDETSAMAALWSWLPLRR
ncbi:hypothetical protein JB92DRAFT_2865841 [Gautieria morchelliformis]|nr:hypothetical protein JB92DRAFT_2865841 [Gautieria morchelliformis]